MKKITLFGGSGFIGQNLAAKLKEKNYYVINFTRNATKYVANIDENIKYSLNSNYIDLIKHLEGSFAVINFAGASIAAKRWSNKYKKIIFESRIKTTKLIVDALNTMETKPSVFINASAVGIYGDCRDKVITEKSPIGNDFLANVCSEWEGTAKLVQPEIRLILPRIGFVLDRKEGGLAKMLLPFKLFLGGPLGSGKQFIPWIHKSDLVNLIIFLLENENCIGEFNCSAPKPIIMKELANEIGKVLIKPSIFKVPTIVLKLILGEQSAIVLNSCRAIPEKALNNNFKFQFEEINKALENLLTNKQ